MSFCGYPLDLKNHRYGTVLKEIDSKGVCAVGHRIASYMLKLKFSVAVNYIVSCIWVDIFALLFSKQRVEVVRRSALVQCSIKFSTVDLQVDSINFTICANPYCRKSCNHTLCELNEVEVNSLIYCEINSILRKLTGYSVVDSTHSVLLGPN